MIKLKNKNMVIAELRKKSIVIEKALIYSLGSFVAELENHAKESAGYKDITSNLKSSIGGMLLKNGIPVAYKGFVGSPTGSSKGKDFINSLISNYTQGYTILLVAGMEYASPLENYHGYNVLKQTELKMQRELPKVLDRLKSQIDKFK